MHISLNDLCQSSAESQRVPVGTVGHLCAVRQSISPLSSCQTHMCNTLVSSVISDIGFFPDITYKHYLIHNIYLNFYNLKDNVLNTNNEDNALIEYAVPMFKLS